MFVNRKKPFIHTPHIGYVYVHENTSALFFYALILLLIFFFTPVGSCHAYFIRCMCWILLKPTSIISQGIHWKSSWEVRIIITDACCLFIHCCWLKCNKFSAQLQIPFQPTSVQNVWNTEEETDTRAYRIFSLLNPNSDSFWHVNWVADFCTWWKYFP